jgi:hypothetical protein
VAKELGDKELVKWLMGDRVAAWTKFKMMGCVGADRVVLTEEELAQVLVRVPLKPRMVSEWDVVWERCAAANGTWYGGYTHAAVVECGKVDVSVKALGEVRELGHEVGGEVVITARMVLDAIKKYPNLESSQRRATEICKFVREVFKGVEVKWCQYDLSSVAMRGMQGIEGHKVTGGTSYQELAKATVLGQAMLNQLVYCVQNRGNTTFVGRMEKLGVTHDGD